MQKVFERFLQQNVFEAIFTVIMMLGFDTVDAVFRILACKERLIDAQLICCY